MKDYWILDDESGEYFHKHSDGRITWHDYATGIGTIEGKGATALDRKLLLMTA